ncbi:CaiB/BaiF family protein [Bordetella bronchiseptica 1289]|uniref:CaiB/BaiF CoA transferase family protein n=1 Tax=Bordetella bronchiseptica TaxID=518 RepID=UPI00029072E6|nr:CoA transferase [Bordetella bronchiseptica]CCN21328.1 CaiB/BaiF family protein [Bordetella bronchiseptica 1289]
MPHTPFPCHTRADDMTSPSTPQRPRFPLRELDGRQPAILDGIKVLDLTRLLAGPVATQMLGDLGAEVVKVEHPKDGDDTRVWSPKLEGHSGTFLSANRNKASITLDLKSADDLETMKTLIRRADVLVENFSAGVMARLGLAYDACVELNPALIYCSISGYGQAGIFRGRGGYDAVFQAESGHMSVTGSPEGEPMRMGAPVTDFTSGVVASNAILAALFHRQRTGEGQFIEIAMQDVAFNMLINFGMNYLASGIVPHREGNSSPLAAPTGVFQAGDGDLLLSCANDRLWQKFALLVEREDLLADERFQDNGARVKHRAALAQALAPVMTGRTVDQWLALLIPAGIPAAAVRNLDGAYAQPYVQERQLVTEILDSKGRSVPTVANPIRFAKTPVVIRRAPPELGEDNAAIGRLFT